MKILGGNQVVFYSSTKGDLITQLTNCMEQLEDYMNDNNVYPGSFIKHNIYIKVTDEKQFEQQKAKLELIAKRRFPLPLIINFIAQAPAEGDVAIESLHIQSTKWNCLYKDFGNGACQHLIDKKKEVVIGSLQINSFPDMKRNAEKAFEVLENMLYKCNFTMSDIVKQWSYIERMLEEDITTQRYQSFNDIRSKYYDTDFEGIGYPASTETGTTLGGIQIEFMAVKGRKDLTKIINNPVQKAPYEYSEKVLSSSSTQKTHELTTPKVERAQYLKLGSKEMVFISATAAIVGERVMAIGDVNEQTYVIIENINKLIAPENLEKHGVFPKKPLHFSLVKVYLKDISHTTTVVNVTDIKFKNLFPVIVQADLPRKDILVELECELIISQ